MPEQHGIHVVFGKRMPDIGFHNEKQLRNAFIPAERHNFIRRVPVSFRSAGNRFMFFFYRFRLRDSLCYDRRLCRVRQQMQTADLHILILIQRQKTCLLPVAERTHDIHLCLVKL